MTGGLRERWAGQPRWVRGTLAVYLLGFVEGFGAHALDLISGGIHVYAPFAPVPLQVFFVSLIVLDPAVVVLLGRVRTAGVPLAGGVIALDALANWIVNWTAIRENPVLLLRPVGLLPITLFGLFIIATSVPLRRAMNRVAAECGSGPVRKGRTYA
ncbi:hypothetical protein OHR86_13055 [Streptomyces sp. NBC_00441]|uniref:hypothetical protein n=1 Tax=Streptomyces sp. NBC_00441 TaxID=2975742 RepID=UPI002E2809D7|nr:hypothetical protein [Streptomyces sp. NBC_00441]